MYQTNQPEFDSSQDDDGQRYILRSEKSGTSEFKSLVAFSAWIDEQLVLLEDSHDGFETLTSVRNFFGR